MPKNQWEAYQEVFRDPGEIRFLWVRSDEQDRGTTRYMPCELGGKSSKDPQKTGERPKIDSRRCEDMRIRREECG